MAKRTIVPSAPKPREITPIVKERLEAWKKYLLGLSSRVKLMSPGDKAFDWEKTTKLLVKAIGGFDKVVIDGWPKEEQVAFIVGYDESPLEDKGVLLENSYVFCYGGFAFGLHHHYFEQTDTRYDETDEETTEHMGFSGGFSERGRTWDYIGGTLIPMWIKEAEEKSVPALPQEAKRPPK